jgi:ketosteroid isomerase-like protein
MPILKDELMELEKEFWNALDDPDFYRENMAKDALAIINGEVKTRDDALAMTHEMPVKWDNIRFQDPRFLQISDDTAAVTYHGAADRMKTGEHYAATITSVYTRRNGKYLLVLTTHTPAAEAATGNGQRTQKNAAASHTR